MRRIKVLLAVVAAVVMMMVVAAPAMAQDFGQEFSIRDITSGAASPTTTIDNAGDNVNLAPATQQTVNTGNVLNEQGVLTDGIGFTEPIGFVDNGFVDNGLVDNGFVDNGFVVGPFVDHGFGTTGDINLEGSSINLSPALTNDATQGIEQAAG